MKTLNASSRFWTTAGVFAGSVFLAGLSQVAVHRTVAQWLVLLYRCYTIPGSNPGWTKVFFVLSLYVLPASVLSPGTLVSFHRPGKCMFKAESLNCWVWPSAGDMSRVYYLLLHHCPFSTAQFNSTFSMNHHCSTSAQNCHVAVNITHVGHRGEILSY